MTDVLFPNHKPTESDVLLKIKDALNSYIGKKSSWETVYNIKNTVATFFKMYGFKEPDVEVQMSDNHIANITVNLSYGVDAHIPKYEAPKIYFEEEIKYDTIELPSGEVSQFVPTSYKASTTSNKVFKLLKEVEDNLYTGSTSFTEESEWEGLAAIATPVNNYQTKLPGLTTSLGGGIYGDHKYAGDTAYTALTPYAPFNLPGDDEDTPAMQASLFTSKQDDWCTPQEVIDMLKFLGHIRLDPCSNPNSLVPAQFKYDLREGFDGLEQPWGLDGMRSSFGPSVKSGYVFVNPPYGKTISQWTQKAIKESTESQTEIVMLVPARTDTKWWQEVIGETSAVCFLKGRLTFKDAPSSAPFPSALLYFGPQSVSFCTNLASKGWTVSQ